MPMKWNELWELLPEKHRVSSGEWQPPLPLILSAWWDTSFLLKKLRFEEHIDWAEKHGVLDTVYKYILDLKESDWLHSDE